MSGATSLIRNGVLQNDLDARFFRIINLDTSNLPPAGIPPTINPPPHFFLNGWDAGLQQWSDAQPNFADLEGDLTPTQKEHIDIVGIVRRGTWQATPIASAFLPSLSEITAPLNNLSLNNKRITNLADPTQPQDAVNMRFMDSLLQGLKPKEAVLCATTSEVGLAGLSRPVDGVTLHEGDRVLVKNQDVGAGRDYQNGIYNAHAGVWTRASDSDTFDELNGAYCWVTSGTVNGGSSWVQSNLLTAIGIGHPVAFVIFQVNAGVFAGDGLTFVGNVLNVGGTADRISVGADAVDIASTYAGQHSIHVLGTVDDGTWHGSVIAPAYGGTGIANAYNIGLVGPFNTALAGLAPPGTPVTLQASGPTSVELPTSGKLATLSLAEVFSNKRIVKRGSFFVSTASPVIPIDLTDFVFISAQATDITSLSGFIGTPNADDQLDVWIRDNGTPRLINWGASYMVAAGQTLPTTTFAGAWTFCRFIYNQVAAKFAMVIKQENMI